ncbi:MAG TPA: citrate/2-methylcitrate synthase [Solirubrobacteraceae bacterium]|jgi:citrate synthase
MDDLLSAAEVAHRLGVRRETVYAYVSRGLLERHPASGHHRSLFAADAVARLTSRARQPGRSGALEVVVDTEITHLDPAGRLSLRGRDAISLARFDTFEQVAGLLWQGDPGAPWRLSPADDALVATLMAPLPESATSSPRIVIALTALATTDPRRGGRRPEDVRAAGSRILAGALAALGPGRVASEDSAADRLWKAFRAGDRGPSPRQRAALDAALILLADHELSASTLSARVAASAWADPYRVVTAALSTLSGVLHGGATAATAALLAEARVPEDAFAVLERRIAAGGPLPGFGHRVYRDRDPRADHLLERLDGLAGGSDRARVVDAMLEAGRALQLPAPNADFGLAALADVMALRADAGSAIFTVARLAGVLAHAIEEYPHRLRFRPRARYVGPTT